MNITLIIIFAYLGLVLSLGPLSRLFSVRNSKEDFFLATRSIGPVLLLLSLFGTHMSAFSLVGATGEGYVKGIGTYGQLASSSAIVAPLVFFFIGIRIWRIGKQHGFVTQCQYFRERWESDLVGLVLFIILVLLLIPYLLIGVLGGGVVFQGIAGFKSPAVGSAIVVVVTFAYVSIGGMRGTAWANGFQTLVFMIIGLAAFFAIVNHLGGSDGLITNLQALAQQVADSPEHRARLHRGEVLSPLKFFSYMLIPLSVATFPHVNMHWLTARSAKTFRPAIVFYPVCILCVWLPTVLLGTLASAQLDLPSSDANKVLVVLIKQIENPVLTGLLAAGVLAAVMSSLDSQTLSLSEMFTTDVVNHYGGKDRLSESQQILLSRIFVALILGITWLVSLGGPGSVFVIGVWCFAGFTALLPVILAALFWKQSTKWGAIASCLATAGSGIWLYNDSINSGLGPAYKPLGLDVHPVAIMLLLSSVAMIVVSLITPKPTSETVHRFFPNSL